MTALHQTTPFLRAYHLLPHRLLNLLCARLMTAQQPAFAVQAAIQLWIRRAGIDMSQFAAEDYRTVEDFFLRRLREGARPLGSGVVSPVDGEVFAAGRLSQQTPFVVKGQRLSLERLVNGRGHTAPLGEYEGGHYAAIFLSPRGYHHIHAPIDAELTQCQWIPGRYFPQNAVALRHIDAVYERNERAALFFKTRPRSDGKSFAFTMVLIGASLVGGIHLADFPHQVWRTPTVTRFSPSRPYEKGQRLAHFSFGSTVVLLFSRGMVDELRLTIGDAVQMGEPLAGLSEP